MVRVMMILAIVTIVSCIPTTAAAQDEQAVKEELQRLQGVWKPISVENEGKQLDPKEDEWTLKITADKVVQLRRNAIHVEGLIQIEKSGKSSKRATWKYTNVEVTDSVIYFFVGRDTLVTCWAGEESITCLAGKVPDWPVAFGTNAPGTGNYLVVWKREK